MENNTQQSWLNEMWERKVPQYLGTYLAVGFALLQFLEFITSRYNLGEYWVDKYLVVWLALAPAIAALIYRGGKNRAISLSGSSNWPKFLIYGNIVIAILLGIFLFNNAGSTQGKTIELTNEEGVALSAVVPSIQKIKTIACFQFENLSGQEELDWWSVAFSNLLMLSLEQRPEYYVINANSLNGFNNRLGLEPYTLPSLAMQREIAQKTRSDYFSRFSFSIEDGKYSLEGQLWPR